jgi:hypothetical protein
MDIAVAIVVSDPGLRRALLALVSGWQGFHAIDGLLADVRGVVISTPRDCAPERCAQLTRAGNRVAILAPVWREHELANYEAAGACGYLPMDFDLLRLSQLISEAGTAIARPA